MLPITPAALALFARGGFLYRHWFVGLYRDTYKQKRYYELINLLYRSCSQAQYAEPGFPESPGSEQQEAGKPRKQENQ